MQTISELNLGNRVDRVIFLINSLEKNPTRFAAKIGKSHTAVNKILKREAEPSNGFIEAIISNFPNINETWLWTGNGTWNTRQEEKVITKENLPDFIKNMLDEKDQRIDELVKQVEYLREQNKLLLSKFSVSEVLSDEFAEVMNEAHVLTSSLTSSLTKQAA